MAKLVWDEPVVSTYETGVSNGVLYPAVNGAYPAGVAWSGLTAVTESPSGAEATQLYADNRPYLNLMSAEKFGCTIAAYTYPDEFEECDGSREIAPGVTIGQQRRKSFGLAYKTLIGNSEDGQDHGYKLHLVYGCLASPSEKAHNTVNDSPEALNFSWTVSTTPVEVPGFTATATLTINSLTTSAAKLALLEAKLFGSETDPASLPLPKEVAALVGN